MKTRNLLFVAMACMGLLSPMHAGVLKVETPNTQLVLDATEGQPLAMLYYGDKSATLEDISNQQSAVSNQMSAVYPAFGDIDMIHLPALQVQHAGGDL
jgi:hypothetical protein